MFFGTTNETQFLRDTTGNRRFWVAETPNAQPRKLLPSLAALDSETVRRIWGEAVTMYKAGEKLYLTPELETVASEIRESFEKENPKVGIIGEYLDRILPPGWEDMDTYTRRQWLETNAVGTVQRRTVCAFEIWAEGMRGNPDRIDRYALKEIHDIMAKLPGWQSSGRKQKTIKPYGRQRFYLRKDERIMANRRDYTNQAGYICPTENAAIRAIERECAKSKKRHKRKPRVLAEQDCARMGVQRDLHGGGRKRRR